MIDYAKYYWWIGLFTCYLTLKHYVIVSNDYLFFAGSILGLMIADTFIIMIDNIVKDKKGVEKK